MKMLHMYTCAFYTTLIGVIISGIIISVQGEHLTVFQNFDQIDHFILIASSLLGGIALSSKAKAMQYESAGRLSIVMYI